jgi:hypothetical protein
MKEKEIKELILGCMDTIQMFKNVHDAETPEEFYKSIEGCANEGVIFGRSSDFTVEEMVARAKSYFADESPSNVITRNFGLRQQAMYIKHYIKK